MRGVRIMVFDRLDAYLCDVDLTKVTNASYTGEVNGEHSLTIETTQELEKTNRLLMRDGMGIWHEYVVLGIEETHDGKEYYCVWSLQYDLAGTFINGPYDCGVVPGHASIPQLPRRAMEVALGSTSRWEIGTITVTNMASASFYRRSGWEGLQTVLERWGGELQATITVGQDGVVSRAVDLLEHVGSSVATRRFDYGHDLKSIKRTISDDVWPCRIVPLGKARETENGGYTRRPDISSVNDGVMWLQDDDVVAETRILNPDGEYEYPTVIVENDTYEEPSEVKAWALEHITEYTRPKVTYEAGVVQFARAGLNPHGVALGDDVVVVDRTFGADGLMITARVTKIVGNLFDPADTTLTIGNMAESLSGQFASMARQVSQISDILSRSQQYQATAEYLSNLLDRINGEINATGGYTYITEGEGLRTYDRPVSNPLVGTEATQVVEIKGGNIRIANSRTSSGDWDWKTVLQSGHILAELVTAANIVAGYIGSADSGNYWDLDSGDFRMAASATLGNKTVQQVLDGVAATITGVDVQYAQGDSATVAPTTGWSTTAPAYEAGKYIWSRTATTDASGVSYSTPVMISGQDGEDGVGISSTTISYGTSASDATEPVNWQASVPTLTKGQWLWVRTVYAYTDSSTKTTYTKSYVGTDGEDGTSVFVQSATKSGDTTTVVIADSDGNTSTLTIKDGEDGTNGTAGANGYVHTAWATSADGSQGFSTSVSAGKTYLGVYTDNTAADSQTYTDYSWSLIKGADGEDGTGITSIVEEYYLSTSSSTQTGGSWSTTQPTWTSGTYIWTRSVITWDTTPVTTTTTTPILATALTQANQNAKEANDAVEDISTQEAIFNLLTNNGALQGLYMSGGQLYVNASYILSGILALGGANNTNGRLVVYDASDNVVATLDKDGLAATGDLVIQKTVTGEFRGRAEVTTGTFYPRTTRAGLDNIGFIIASKRLASGAYYNHNNTVQIFPNFRGTLNNSVIFADSALEIQSQQHNSSPYTTNGGMNPTAYATKLIIGNGGLNLYYEALGENSSLTSTNTFSVSQGGSASCLGMTITGNLKVQDTTTDIRLWGPVDINGAVDVSSNLVVHGNCSVSGTKPRIVKTEDYGTLTNYAYETPSPMFGDVGSAVLDSGGYCIVSIDDLFSETARVDLAYQVFLQKCGAGDVWVEEKHRTHFVVRGTPGLHFDWEVKARQTGFENLRIDSFETDSAQWDGLQGSERAAMATGELLNGETQAVPTYTDPVSELEEIYMNELLQAS